MSLWNVNDHSTSLLMRRFYENRFRDPDPMSKAEALQDAKNWLRNYEDEYGERPFQHPYFWAPFVYIGLSR